MVTESRLKELIEIKNKQRAVRKAEYWKQMTNPHRHATGEGGTLFDAGISRWTAMEATSYNFFKPNTRNAAKGLVYLFLPMALTMYWVKTSRDKKEHLYRTGMVSYRDRDYKFI